MDYSSILQSMMQKGSATGTGVGQIQAQRPQAVPYAQPPQMGPLSQQAYAMAGPDTQHSGGLGRVVHNPNDTRLLPKLLNQLHGPIDFQSLVQGFGRGNAAPQIAQPPPPMMGTPNRPGFPGGAPQIPQIPGMHIPGVPMRDPMQILQLLRGHGMGGGMY